MRIVVFGGNDGTGACVVRQALARGDEVVSISRRGWGMPVDGLTDVKLDATRSADLDEVLRGADAVVIVTEWDQFRALDLDRIKLLMRSPRIIDLRNIYKPADMRARGFAYASVGRP